MRRHNPTDSDSAGFLIRNHKRRDKGRHSEDAYIPIFRARRDVKGPTREGAESRHERAGNNRRSEKAGATIEERVKSGAVKRKEAYHGKPL